MTHAHDHRILTINSGSSSVKVAVFLMGTKETRTLAGRIERIGLRGGHFQIKDGDGHVLVEKHADLPDHATALTIVLTWLHKQKQCLDAVGHRLVHGGQHYRKPQLITPTMEKALGYTQTARSRPSATRDRSNQDRAPLLPQPKQAVRMF